MASSVELTVIEGSMEASTPARSASVPHEAQPALTESDDLPNALGEQGQASIIPEDAEGVYAWIVLFACGLISFWAVGTVYCWGVMQAALVKQGVSHPSTLSWIGSIAFTCIAILGVLNARLIQRYGPRRTVLFGISILALSEVASGSVTHNVGGLFMTAGVLSGIGTSMCFMVVNVVPAQYFDRRRGLANGIVCAGGGIGGTVISLAMNSSIQRLGPAWTFRIFGLVKLATGVPAAWLIIPRHPIEPHRFIEWRLFLDVKFTILFLIGAIATFPLLIPPFFIPLYSASLGLSPSTGAALIAAFNASSAVGRLFSGFATDHLGPLNILVSVLFLTTVSTFIIWPLSDSLGPLVIFAVINGASNGGFFSTIPTVVRAISGAERSAVAWGMIVTGWVGGYLMGPPIAGYLLDAYGGPDSTLAAYRPAMFYAGGMALVALVLAGTVRLYVDRRIWRRV